MDIVGNPEWVASEIRRVLKPGGVWVNFSLPLFTRSIPRELGPIGLEELPLYLNEADLELVDAQHQRVSFLNLERVAENTAALWNSSHFYTARKPVRGSTGGATVNKKSLLDEDVRWWKGVPHFVSTGGVHISSIADAEFGTKPKSSARMEISFRLQSSRKRFVLREENARCLRALFELIDGNRTYREIHEALVTKGGGVDASLLPELSHYLSDRLGLINVQL
jgi:hypothetical protein